MRSSADPRAARGLALCALAWLAACGGTPAPAPTPVARAPARAACTPVAPRCDPSVGDQAVFALVQKRCHGCHGDHGIAGHDFPSIEALRKAPVADMVGTCQMPPDGAFLTPAERTQIVSWAACAAP